MDRENKEWRTEERCEVKGKAGLNRTSVAAERMEVSGTGMAATAAAPHRRKHAVKDITA